MDDPKNPNITPGVPQTNPPVSPTGEPDSVSPSVPSGVPETPPVQAPDAAVPLPAPDNVGPLPETPEQSQKELVGDIPQPMSGADLPPIVPPPPPKSKTKLIAAIVAVVLLVVAIPAGIFLVGQTQELREKAQEGGPPPPPIIGGDETATPTPGAESGKTGQFRRCEINPQSGAFENCGSWTAGTLTMDKPTVGYGAFTYTEGSKQFVVQSLVEDNGTTSRYRTCEINPALQGGFASNNCTAWTGGITFDPAIVSYGAYSFTLAGKQYVVQSLIDLDGKTSKFRKCEITTNGAFTGCSDWSNVTLDQETNSYGAFEFTGADGKTHIVQSLVDKAGTTSKYRKCDLNTETGALSNCGSWLGPITFPEGVVSYGAFSFAHPTGKQYVVQSIVTAEEPFPASISAKIEGLATAQAGEPVKFTATAEGGNLKWVRAYWAKKEATTEELKKRSAWRGLGQFHDCTGSTCTQEFNFIPPGEGTYYVAVAALQVDPQGNSIPCSGNPLLDNVKIPSQSPIKGAQDNGWIDCGASDRIELAASGILGAPACNKIELSRAGSTIQVNDIKLNDTITATAFCSTTDSTDSFDKIHFRIISPTGQRADTDKTEVERAASKDVGGKRFYSTSHTFKVDQEGTYKIQIWAHSPKKGWGGK